MNYKPRDGIIFVSICDAFLLVPTRKASEECPHIATLSMLEAIFWKQLSKGKTVAEISELYSHIAFLTLEEARIKVDGILSRLCSKGFLLPVEEQTV